MSTFYNTKPAEVDLESCTRWKDKVHTMLSTQPPESSPVPQTMPGRPLADTKCTKECVK